MSLHVIMRNAKPRKPLLKFETKYKLCLWKNYFETGYALTSYMKYAILAVGANQLLRGDLTETFMWGIGYGIFCYIIGWLWYTSDFVKANIEVSNNYNKFVKEVRGSLKKK